MCGQREDPAVALALAGVMALQRTILTLHDHGALLRSSGNPAVRPPKRCVIFRFNCTSSVHLRSSELHTKRCKDGGEEARSILCSHVQVCKQRNRLPECSSALPACHCF